MTQNPTNPEARKNAPSSGPITTGRTEHTGRADHVDHTGRTEHTGRAGHAARSDHTERPARTDTRSAAKTGLIITAVGVLLFNIAPFMEWVTTDDDNTFSGYETDSLIPFVAYLGLGLLIALFVASGRARRGQHRGLTLVSMAVGIAAAAQSLAFAIEPMGALERGDDLSVELGVWVALIAAGVWAIGSGLLAKEIEGDDEEDHHDNHLRGTKTAR